MVQSTESAVPWPALPGGTVKQPPGDSGHGAHAEAGVTPAVRQCLFCPYRSPPPGARPAREAADAC